MTTSMQSQARSKPLLIVAVVVVIGVVGFLGANAHLAYVAITSQPDCVSHAKTSGTTLGVYRAAKSSC
jgi:hypothetical protein